MKLFVADRVFAGGAFRAGWAVAVRGADIEAAGPAAELAARFPGAERVPLAGRALVPGTVNVHNHSFQSLLRGIRDDRPFFEWREQALYRYAPRLGPEGVYAGALLAFGEMLGYGVTTVADFFYLHDGGNEGARAVIRAARALGIRVVLARTMYDWEGAPRTFRETVREAVSRTRELAAEWRGVEGVSIHPAPHSPHGASAEMIRAGAELARELGTRFHIHVAEGQYEVDQIRARHGAHPVAWLDGLGCLSEDTLAVHCVWCGDAELDLLAARGAKLAYNPASNMFLGDGVTRIPDALRRGIAIGLGTDGGCTNSRTSVFDEMRTCALLQKVARLDPTAVTAAQVFEMGTAGGGRALGLPVGAIAPGLKADLVAIDLEDLSLWPTEHLLQNVVYAMNPRAVREVWVSGELVARDGAPLRVPAEEIRRRVAETVGRWSD